MSTEDLLDQSVHPEAAAGPFKLADGWGWDEPRHGEHFRRCTWCGSIHPEDLAAEPVWAPEWADQKYGWPHKFYVPIPNRDPERLYVIGSTNAVSAPPRSGVGEWIAWDELTSEQLEIARAQGHGVGRYEPPTWVSFGTHADHFGKFYTVHLSDRGLDPQVKQDIERRSGLAFDFDGSRVRWRPVAAGPTG